MRLGPRARPWSTARSGRRKARSSPRRRAQASTLLLAVVSRRCEFVLQNVLCAVQSQGSDNEMNRVCRRRARPRDREKRKDSRFRLARRSAKSRGTRCSSRACGWGESGQAPILSPLQRCPSRPHPYRPSPTCCRRRGQRPRPTRRSPRDLDNGSRREVLARLCRGWFQTPRACCGRGRRRR